jgi:hypothetical protein
MKVFQRRYIKEEIQCACGCGKTINRYDKKGRERKFHGDCFCVGKKLSPGARNYIRLGALKEDRIEISIKNLKKQLDAVRDGLRPPGHYIDGYVRAGEYLMVKYYEHPRRNKTGYVFEHILVAEAKIGRHLNPGETVHHLNRDKKDNRPENLIILSSPAEHMALHSREDGRRDSFGRFAHFNTKEGTCTSANLQG